jgi:hypothetical protein
VERLIGHSLHHSDAEVKGLEHADFRWAQLDMWIPPWPVGLELPRVASTTSQLVMPYYDGNLTLEMCETPTQQNDFHQLTLTFEATQNLILDFC